MIRNLLTAKHIMFLGLFAVCSYVSPAFADAMVIQTDGCNSTAHTQIPRTQNLFIGRHYFDESGALYSGECSPDIDKSNHQGLVLEQLDWSGKRLSVIKPLLPVPMTVAGGPMRGAIIKSAYDPSVVVYRGQYWVAFECGIPNGKDFGVEGTSSCMAPFDLSRQEIARDNVYVVVSGKHTPEKIMYSASVPALFALNDHLYLYWSVLKVNTDRSSSDFQKFYGVSVHGAELVPGKDGYLWVKNAGRMAYSNGQNGIEVWAPDTSNPMSDSAVGIRSVWAHGNDVIALAAIGGGGCARPGTNTPGCFRMAMAKASEPLGYHIFNTPLLDEASLPTNPQDYTRPARDPQGNYFFLGNFYYPYANGYSELRVMPAQNEWPANVTAIKHQVVAFPFVERNLWPTGE